MNPILKFQYHELEFYKLSFPDSKIPSPNKTAWISLSVSYTKQAKNANPECLLFFKGREDGPLVVPSIA